MRAEDDHDPLDSWLNQQVRPLSPPPGTFALIKTRARRRKLRKLAISVVSAAAVAAAVAVAVPNVTALHLSPSSTKGNSVADGSQQKASQEPDGKGTPYISPTPSAPASGPAAALVKPSGPVPANFQPSSVTFVNQQTGWVIGQAGTPGKCDNKTSPYICTSIARTDDAGQTWQGGPAPSATGPSGATGVSGIRFLDGVNGWAFGPELWATHDAGNTWTKIDTGGQRVTDLETVAGRAYALFATCSGTSAAGFAMNCTSFTLMTTAGGSDDWGPAGGSTSELTNGGSATSAVLALTGSVGYLLAPDGTIYSGPIGGAWRPAGTAPCQPGTPQASGLPGSAWLALVSSTQLAIACDGTAVTSPPQISASNDGGRSWTRSTAGWDITGFGAMTTLTAAPNGTLVLATTAGLYVLPVGTAQWKPTSATGSNAPKGGFSYVGMTTDGQGVALPSDMELQEVWMTLDGGLAWAPSHSITPGN
jgi:photosystem II stability/assembly factor-like uncharacterized protein